VVPEALQIWQLKGAILRHLVQIPDVETDPVREISPPELHGKPVLLSVNHELQEREDPNRKGHCRSRKKSSVRERDGAAGASLTIDTSSRFRSL